MTDLNLLELRLDSRAHVVVRKFNKPEEGRCGADWEWWFSDGHRWIGCRVQAKVIDLHTGRYEELHYRNPKKAKHQCDLLIEKAAKSCPRRLPLYALYSHWPRTTLTPVFRCCVNPSAHTVYGCSITSAWQVRRWRKARRGRAVSKLIDGLQPWHCLLCPGSNTVPLPERVSAWAANSQAALLRNPVLPEDPEDPEEPEEAEDPTSSDESEEHTGMELPEITETPPDYVLSITEDEGAAEMPASVEDLAGVLVVVETDELGQKAW